MDNPLIWLLLVPIGGAILTYLSGNRKARYSEHVAITTSLIVFLISIYTYIGIDTTQSGYQMLFSSNWVPAIGSEIIFGIDGLSAPILVLTGLLTFIAILYSKMRIKEKKPAYYTLLLILEVGLIGVFVSLDFVLFFIFWEICLVPMFFIIAVWGEENSLYASIKFFIYTHLGGLFLLLAILAIYLNSPIQTFSMIELTQIARNYTTHLQTLIFIGVFIGVGIKMPIFPFHTWLPDAHVEAPTPGSILLAGVLLKMGGICSY